MSRTDKTVPLTVKVFYYPEFLEEYHDHREGPCDLPPRPTSAKQWPEFELHHGGKRDDDETRCYWCANYATFWSHPLTRCSCPMCGYDAYCSVPLRKAQRIEGRRYCRDGWRDEY